MNVGVVGYGAMGKLLVGEIERVKDMSVAGIVDIDMLDSLDKIEGKIDVIIDFSHPSNLDHILEYSKKNKTPLVLAITTYTKEDLKKIEAISSIIPIVISSNCSLGITVLKKVLRDVALLLKDDYDMEIIEKHHNKKVDSPSGTARVLLDAIDPDNEYKHVYGRKGIVGERKKEIGIHAVRGGTIFGEHSVLFAGEDEILEFKHEAMSKMIFIKGAIKAARFISSSGNGLFDMEDVLKLK